MRRRTWIGLIGWLALCYGAAAFGAQFEPGAWYGQLARPAWTPPAPVFPVVWTVLYGLMAAAAWLVWKRRGFAGAPWALGAFLIQLALNAAWSWLFFGLHRIGPALLDALLLWAAIAITALLFWRHRPLAAALLLPYLLWVSFAVCLNFEIWRLDQG
jgi:tryptophan-rich sensory protein